MGRKKFYILWINRNGMHMWGGPKPSRESAEALLDMVLDKSGGSHIIEEA